MYALHEIVNLFILSASLMVSGSFLFKVSGSRRAVTHPIIPLIPNTVKGRLGASKVSPNPKYLIII